MDVVDELKLIDNFSGFAFLIAPDNFSSLNLPTSCMNVFQVAYSKDTKLENRLGI